MAESQALYGQKGRCCCSRACSQLQCQGELSRALLRPSQPFYKQPDSPSS